MTSVKPHAEIFIASVRVSYAVPIAPMPMPPRPGHGIAARTAPGDGGSDGAQRQRQRLATWLSVKRNGSSADVGTDPLNRGKGPPIAVTAPDLDSSLPHLSHSNSKKI